MNPTQSQNNTLDPSIVALSKAIGQSESGGDYNAKGKSGETGAYQFTQPTWKAWAGKHLGDPNAPMTPENQDKVAYSQIKEWGSQGYKPSQIASLWNSGKPDPTGNVGINKYGVKFDTPSYVKSVGKAYDTIMKGGQAQSDPNNPSNTENTQTQNENGTWVSSSPNDTPTQAGLKAAANVIPSAYNFAKGVASTMNPVNIASTAGQIPGAFSDLSKESGGILPAIVATAKEIPNELYKGLVPRGIRQAISGDTEGAQKTFTEDPFGQAAPLVFAAEGGAKLADKFGGGIEAQATKNYAQQGENAIINPKTGVYGNALDKTISTIAKPVTAPLNALKNAGGVVAGTMASHLTGLDPSTIIQTLKDPQAFGKMAQEQTTRGGLAGEVSDAIDSRITNLEKTGKGYESIRQNQNPVPVPKGFIEKSLSDNGLIVNGKGKIVAGKDSITRNPADIKAIQNFYDNWKNTKELTPNQYLNMRGDLADLSKFDLMSGKTKASADIGRELYDTSNKQIGSQIPGLRELDAKYAPEVKFLKQVKKDYLNSDGTFKDNAVSKIANAGNKAELLKRLEAVLPGITKRIQILKAVEDIQRANGIKVGTYTRGLLEAGGVLTGNIPAIIAAVITHPTNAVRILRIAGYTGKLALPIVRALQVIGGDVKSSLPGVGLLRNQNQ